MYEYLEVEVSRRNWVLSCGSWKNCVLVEWMQLLKLYIDRFARLVVKLRFFSGWNMFMASFKENNEVDKKE